MRTQAPLALLPLASLVLLSQASGCVLVSNDPGGQDGGGFVEPWGDLAFDWSFAGELDCAAAGVDEVDIALFRSDMLEDEIVGEPCVGSGLILTDLYEGPYDVVVDAYDRNGVLLYSGSFFARVRGEETTDVGLVELAAVNGPAPVGAGELGLYWSFLYPTDETPEIDCDVAGVRDVGIVLTDLATDAVVFEDVRPCAEEGIIIAPLDEGRYALRVTGAGDVSGANLLMYDSGLRVVDVLADEFTELGDVELGRVAQSFADIAVAWSLVDADQSPVTCEAAGVTDVRITIQRFGAETPDDVTSVPCGEGSVLREVFVPAGYAVVVEAETMSITLVASTTIDAVPGSVTEVRLTLEAREMPEPDVPADGEPSNGGAAGGDADEGSVVDGSAGAGVADDGSADDGTADGGAADDGTADGGMADDGTADGGMADGGAADDAAADAGSSEGDSAGEGSAGGDSSTGSGQDAAPPSP